MIMSCQGLITSRSGSVAKQTFVNIRKVKLHDLSGMKFTDDHYTLKYETMARSSPLHKDAQIDSADNPIPLLHKL